MERLVATIQKYAWGDTRFIAQLQSRPRTGAPEAELWMGAHPSAPSRVESTGRLLDELIAQEPESTLGRSTAESFGQLPFLAKVLAAARPLSIQAHPTSKQAAEGFARENAAGIEMDSPTRTYRDASHKPELICALTEFQAKCGLRSLDATRELFGSLGAGLAPVRDRLAQEGSDAQVLADVLAFLLRSDAAQAASLASRAVEASATLIDGPFAADSAWSAGLYRAHPGDVGVVVALLLNHVVLRPGQALFLGAGNLHCYLRGAGVEVMANSDNVVRGGLTEKHVDVEDLLAVVDCTPVEPALQTATAGIHTFDTPAPEFSLTRAVIADSVHFTVSGPEIVIVTEGSVQFTSADGQELAVPAGAPVWVPASDESYVVSGEATLFRVTVG